MEVRSGILSCGLGCVGGHGREWKRMGEGSRCEVWGCEGHLRSAASSRPCSDASRWAAALSSCLSTSCSSYEARSSLRSPIASLPARTESSITSCRAWGRGGTHARWEGRALSDSHAEFGSSVAAALKTSCASDGRRSFVSFVSSFGGDVGEWASYFWWASYF